VGSDRGSLSVSNAVSVRPCLFFRLYDPRDRSDIRAWPRLRDLVEGPAGPVGRMCSNADHREQDVQRNCSRGCRDGPPHVAGRFGANDGARAFGANDRSCNRRGAGCDDAVGQRGSVIPATSTASRNIVAPRHRAFASSGTRSEFISAQPPASARCPGRRRCKA
jgi:hypothetical protein